MVDGNIALGHKSVSYKWTLFCEKGHKVLVIDPRYCIETHTIYEIVWVPWICQIWNSRKSKLCTKRLIHDTCTLGDTCAQEYKSTLHGTVPLTTLFNKKNPGRLHTDIIPSHVNFVTLRWRNQSIPELVKNKYPFILYYKCNSCWWSGGARTRLSSPMALT